MKPLLFSIFILLMLAGNGFAFYKLIIGKHQFLTRFPRLTNDAYNIFRLLPLINVVALIGGWFFSEMGGVPRHLLFVVCYWI
jgi:hypothetical protein